MMRVWLASIVVVLGTMGVGARDTRAEPRARVAIVVIVGSKSPLTAISSRTLMTLYLARAVDDLVPLNRPVRSPERVAFDERILKMSANEVGRYWVDQGVRGERGAPRAIASAGTVGKLVSKFPSAVGYVRADELPNGVRVLKIDGKAPTDADYPLWIEVAP